MGLLDKIKADAAKSGQNKGKFVFFKEGEKKRIRFLTDLEDGIEIEFHDNFEAGINVPCQEAFGRHCQYCGEDGIRTRTQYAWSVWDYEAKEVKILMYPMNNCSPLGAIAAMYENYDTLLDRDFIISVSGKAQNRTFSVVPMDKNKFRNDKAKPLSKSALLKIIDKAYPAEDIDDDDEEDEAPKKRPGKNSSKSKAKSKVEDDYDDEYEDDWEDEEADEVDYSEMSAKELYKLCKERDIKVALKKSENYYIKKLEAYDEAHSDWESEEDDDEWEED